MIFYLHKFFTEHRFMFNFLNRFFFLKTSKTKFIVNIWMCVRAQIPALCPTYILSHPFSHWYKLRTKCHLSF